MSKFISYFALLCMSVGLSVMVLEHGWGLHPQSWWWIIGGGVFGHMVVHSLFDALAKESKK